MDDFDPAAFAGGAAAGIETADQPPPLPSAAPLAGSAISALQGLLDPASFKPQQPQPSAALSAIQGLLDPSSTAPSMIQSAARNGQPFESLAGDLSKMGVNLDQAKQQHGLETARAKYANAEEDPLRYIMRRSIPGFSTGYSAGQSYRVKRALDRLNAGTADQQDHEMIAQHERLAEIDRNRSTGEAVVSGLARIPAIVGEVAAAGPLLSKVPGGLVGRSLAMPAVVPSLGAGEGAINRAIQQGGSPLNPKNLAPAYAQSALSAAIIGSLQNPLLGKVPTRAGRAAVGGVAFTTEQQAADAIQSTADKVLPEAYKSHTEYGLLGDLAKGKEGEALKKGIVQTLTGAAFAAMHGKPTAPIIDVTTRVLADAKANDIPPDHALDALIPARRAYAEAKARDPNLSRQDVEELAKQFDGPGREELDVLAALHKPKTVSPGENAPESTQVVGQQQESARGTSPPAAEPPAAEPATLPVGLDALSDAEVGQLAKGIGLTAKGLREKAGEPWVQKLAQTAIDAKSPRKPATAPPAEGGNPAAEAEIAPPAKPGSGERYYRTPDSKGHEDNVDAAIGELVGNQFAGKWFSRTFEGNAGYKGHVQLEFRNEHLGGEGDVVDRGERDVRIGGKAPMYMHKALSAIRYRGDPASPQFEKLRGLIEDANKERATKGLDPIDLLTGNAAKSPPASGKPAGEGRPITLSVEGGAKTVPAVYGVREIGDVVASHKAVAPYSFLDRVKSGEYPEGLQPRNYSTDKKEQAKVIDQAGRLDPTAMLADHPEPGVGPPTITREGNIAVNGNGRQMMLERSRDLGTYEPYKKSLIERAAQYGLDPAEVAKMKEPALYRLIDMKPDSPEARKFATEGNGPIAKQQSLERQAAGHADLIDEGVLRSLRLEGDETFTQAVADPAGGRSFRQKLYERLPANVRDVFFDPADPKNIPLTDAGKLYVSNMMLAKVVPIGLIEQLGMERRRMLANVEGAIPQLMKFRADRPELDVTPQMLEALGFLGRNPDVKDQAAVNDALDQLDLFSGQRRESISPGGRMMLDFLMQPNGTKQFRTKLAAVLKGEQAGKSLMDILAPAGDTNPIENIAGLLGVKYRPGAAFGSAEEMGHAAKTLALNGRSQQAIEEGIRSAADEAVQHAQTGEPRPLPGSPDPGDHANASPSRQPAGPSGNPAAPTGNVAGSPAVSDPRFRPDLAGAGPPPAGASDRPAGSGVDGVAKAALDFLKGESGHYWVPSYEAVRTAIAKATRYVKDETDKWAGVIAPKITRLARTVGEKLGEYVAVSDYVEKALPRYLDQVFGEKITEAERHLYGAVATEWQLQHTAAAYRDRASREPDPDEKKSLLEAADNVRSVIGPDSPITSQAQYESILFSPEFVGILKRYKAHFVPGMEERFKQAMGLDDAASIDSFTQVPGFPMNLKAAKVGESPTAVTTTLAGAANLPTGNVAGSGPPGFGSPRAGNLKNMRVSRLGTSRQRQGDAEAYDTDFFAMLEASLKTSYRLAKKADLMRTAIGEGIAHAGPERSKFDFEGVPAREIPGVFTRGTPEGKAGKTSLFVHPEAYSEMRQALELDERTNWPVVKAVNQVLTKAALISTVEAAFHGKNLLTFLMNPGVRPLRDLLPNVYRVLAKDKATRDKLVELARIGAAKEKGFDTGVLWGGKTDPTLWASKLLDVLDNSMRLTANDAFNRLQLRRNPLTGKPLIENTQTNRRDFINQLGQYKKAAQAKMIVFLRDSGLGPFATAGMNYMIQSGRSLTMNPGVKGTSLSSDAMLRTEKLAKAIGLLAATGLANYLLWGRADGDDSTPLGGLKVGEGQGKTSYVNIGTLIGVARGLRETGLLAVMEGERKGEKAGVTADHAADDVFHAIIHPAVGPGVATAYTAISGRNTLGTRVASSPRTKGGDVDPTGSQDWENLKAALRNANPVYAQATGFNKAPKEADERAGRTVGELTALQKGTLPGRPLAEVPAGQRAAQLLGPFQIHTRKKMSYGEQNGIEEAMRKRRMGMR